MPFIKRMKNLFGNWKRTEPSVENGGGSQQDVENGGGASFSGSLGSNEAVVNFECSNKPGGPDSSTGGEVAKMVFDDAGGSDSHFFDSIDRKSVV